MGLETGTYIADLVATNPLGSDQRSTADDHLRLIKAVLKATLVNADYALDLALLSGLSSNVQAQLNAVRRKQTLAYNGVLAQHHNLVIANNTTNPTYQIDIAADGLILSNTTGLQLKFENIANTVDITASGVNGLDTGTEAISTEYHLWIIANDTALYSGTATSTTANKLVDTSANFSTVKVGDIVFNTTDYTTARITAIDAATQLSLSADIFASGETYEIFAVAGLLSTSATAPTMPSGYTYKGYVGAIYNDSSSDLIDLVQYNESVAVYYNVLSNQNAITYTAVPLIVAPTTATKAAITVSCSAIAADAAYVEIAAQTSNPTSNRRHGVTANNYGGTQLFGYGASTILLIEPQTIYYKVPSANTTATIYITGWEY